MKKQKGITLIALVITIIVMLILAGVTIGMVVGENGILKRAEDAAVISKRASIEETIQLEYLGAFGTDGKVNMSDLADGLIQQGATAVLENGNGLVATFDGNNYYIDEEGNVAVLGSADNEVDKIVTANEPKLVSGMIPIKYNGKNWVICSNTDSDWYSYTKNKKQWANVMLSDGKYDSTATVGTVVENDELGSTFVWIPRYAYKITSGYKGQKGSLDIVWLNNDTNEYSCIENGKMKTKNATKTAVLNETFTAYKDYVVHPCFQNGNGNYANGEWDSELSGIWVAKFEGGYPMEDNVNDSKAAKKISVESEEVYYPVFKGQRYSYNYLTISQIYSMLKEIDGASNPYGLTATADSHFIKNSEWGAVAYLSYSAYGIGNNTEAKEISLNNVNLNGKVNSISTKGVWAVTGYAGEHEASSTNSMATNTFSVAPEAGLTEELSNGTITSYAWYTSKGVSASTTGNIYGIYDIAGGQNEMTAAYVDYDKTKASYLTTYGSSFTNDGNTKYATAYKAYASATNYGTNDSFREWTLENGYFGDGLFEVSTVDDLTTGGYCAWYGDWQEADATHEPFFLRGGGYHNTSDAGTFYLADDGGYSDNDRRGFRAVLVGE